MRSQACLRLAATAVLTLLPVRAELIPLVNASFENLTGIDPIHFTAQSRLKPGHYSSLLLPPTAAGFLIQNPAPGWSGEVSAGTAGTMAPLVGAGGENLFTGVPDGQNTLFIESDGFFQQFLTPTYQPDTRYTLTADVGRPSAAPPPDTGKGFTLSLGAGIEWIAINLGTPAVPAGEFRRAEIAYTVVAGDPLIGQPITVVLGNTGTSVVHFDNVRLDAQSLAAPKANIDPAVEVKWTSRKGEQYRVDRATRLENPDWTPITGTLNGTGAIMSLFDAAPDQVRYYRIVPVRP